jgi:hypothetical protein
MTKYNDRLKHLTEGLKSTRKATLELTTTLRKIQRAEKSALRKTILACTGGQCHADPSSASEAKSPGGSANTLAGSITRTVTSSLKTALSGDFARVLRNLFSNLARSIGSMISRSLGGGPLGGILGGVISGGLSLLAGRLFRRKQRVVVDNTVQTEVLNFPAATNLTLAANPASRLFGGRAVVRGPAFAISIDYRNGAEDLVTAKVAQKLSDINAMQGVN